MRVALASLAALALAGCGSSEPEPAPSPTPSATPDKPKSLVPADLGALVLGARIEGPQGPEVTGTFAVDGETLADVVSYVACPEGLDPCDPATAPEGTVYTYVHRVTPADGITGATLFRTGRAAAGFANIIGFDKAEAVEVLGEDGRIDVASDNGALVWRVIGGDGWAAGETLTFYWQSTLAPEGPREAFQFEADGTSAQGSGPFPPREVPVEGSVDETPAR
ncbi:MAG: hypothetical protein ACO1OD_08110 [Croceibacterium sp.]